MVKGLLAYLVGIWVGRGSATKGLSPCTPATLRTPLQAHRTTGCNLLHLHPKLLCTPLHLHPQVYDVCGTDMRLYNQPLIKFTKACVQGVSGTNWFLSGEGAGLG